MQERKVNKKISELSDDELRKIIEQVLEEQGLRKKDQAESGIQLNLEAPGARESLGRVYATLAEFGRARHGMARFG